MFVGQPRCACAHDDAEACSYRVEWAINPHMEVGGADPQRACEEHARFVATLRAHGARVVRLPFLHGEFDSVFVKDSAIVVDGRVLPATPRFAERSDEPTARAHQYARLGAAVAPPLPTHLEGGDVVIAARRRLAFMGHGFRTDAASAMPLARFLGCEVVALELVDPALYHLDTALAVLSDGTLLACPDAFTLSARRTLQRLPFDLRWVARDEALAFALNIVELDDVLVARTTASALRDRRVVTVQLDEFLRAGGSAACLVSVAHDVARATALAA